MPARIRARSRVLYILQLFERRPVWTVEEIAGAMKISASSAYRDVQELSRTGFLDPVLGAGYVLGPAFIRYDRLIRRADPLIGLAAPAMRALLARTTQRATAVLCRRFHDCVICVHQEPGSAPHPLSTYERGVAVPLCTGATSKAILAHLDERMLKRVYLENEEAIREASGRANWKDFRAELSAIRREGHAVTIGELAANRVGVAAPVRLGRQVVAALSLVLDVKDFPARVRKAFPQAVVDAAQALSGQLSTEEAWCARG